MIKQIQTDLEWIENHYFQCIYVHYYILERTEVIWQTSCIIRDFRSYNCFMCISVSLGSNICGFYTELGVTYLIKLKNQLITTGAVDNIDHNPCSITCVNECFFFGTGFWLFRYPAAEIWPTERKLDLDRAEKLCTQLLQIWYLSKSDTCLPILEGLKRSTDNYISENL